MYGRHIALWLQMSCICVIPVPGNGIMKVRSAITIEYKCTTLLTVITESCSLSTSQTMDARSVFWIDQFAYGPKCARKYNSAERRMVIGSMSLSIYHFDDEFAMPCWGCRVISHGLVGARASLAISCYLLAINKKHHVWESGAIVVLYQFLAIGVDSKILYRVMKSRVIWRS